MEPYWTFNYKIPLGETVEHKVALYEYSPKALVLTTTANFGKAFSDKFKEIGGKFNPHLKISDPNNSESGWIFRANNDTQDDLLELLKKIHTEEIKPKFYQRKNPDFDEKTKHNKIYNQINSLIELIGDEKDEITFSSNEDGEIIFYFNKDDETITKGDCIYSITSAHRNLDIYQFSFN